MEYHLTPGRESSTSWLVARVRSSLPGVRVLMAYDHGSAEAKIGYSGRFRQIYGDFDGCVWNNEGP
jgi:hypothetical protein